MKKHVYKYSGADAREQLLFFGVDLIYSDGTFECIPKRGGVKCFPDGVYVDFGLCCRDRRFASEKDALIFFCDCLANYYSFWTVGRFSFLSSLKWDFLRLIHGKRRFAD